MNRMGLRFPVRASDTTRFFFIAPWGQPRGCRFRQSLVAQARAIASAAVVTLPTESVLISMTA